MEIEYKGYTIEQNVYNWHIVIRKNGRMVMHSQCNKPLSAEELCSIVDNYIESVKKCKELQNSIKLCKKL